MMAVAVKLQTEPRPRSAVAVSCGLNDIRLEIFSGLKSPPSPPPGFIDILEDTPPNMPRNHTRSKLAPRAIELLTAALELFAERDFASVTIKEIGDSVGVNTALIYYYFGSKEGLFQATLKNAVSQAVENYRLLRQRHKDPLELISDWFQNNIELSRPIQQLIKIMLDYSTSKSKRKIINTVIKEFYDVECGILEDAIENGIRSGKFRKVDPKRVAQIVSTHLDGIMVRGLIHADFDIRLAIEDFKSVFLEYVGIQAHSRAFPKSATRSSKRTSTP